MKSHLFYDRSRKLQTYLMLLVRDSCNLTQGNKTKTNVFHSALHFCGYAWIVIVTQSNPDLSAETSANHK